MNTENLTRKKLAALVVEDNPGDLLLISDYLEEGFDAQITIAKSFRDMQQFLTQKGNHIDIILLDLSLPDKTGRSLIEAVLIEHPDCPVIILTGFADLQFSIEALSLGIDDYLIKDEVSAASLFKSIMFSIERKKTLKDLKESEKRYSNLFQLSPQPNWIFDPETLNILQVNNAAVNLYGYTREAFLSMNILDIRIPELNKTKEIIIDEIDKHKEKSLSFVSRHRKKNGEIIEVEIYGTPIMIKDKLYRSVIAIDITEKVLFENRITRAIIKTQEDERYEIGGELHDNVCQILAASQMSLGMMQKELSDREMEWFHHCRDHIRLATNEIRNLSHRLAPAFFDESTLEDSFRMLLKTFNINKLYQIAVYFNDEIKQFALPMDLKLNLYRILQEQLRNITKYAEAKNINVSLEFENGCLQMTIADDGVGFDIAQVKSGIGLANMKRRTELFSGHLLIRSERGKGCEIEINIPLPAGTN